MTYSALIAIRIRTLCEKRGITINHLAAMSGLRQSSVDNIMREVCKAPQVSTLHKIAISFNMTLSEFLDFPELNEYQPEEDCVR